MACCSDRSIRRIALAPLLPLLLIGCAVPGTDLDTLDSGVRVSVDTVATGLEVPWDLDFAPDGRIFVTERPGRIRVIENGRLQPDPWAELEVAERSEIGLMGIALAPDFATTGNVYVVGAFDVDGDTRDRVWRLIDRDGAGSSPELILDEIPAARFHAGAALDFGPDGMLYLTAGDALRPGRSADLSSLAGKVLRITPDGSVPQDNPFAGSPVFALGIRNAQGLAWHPGTGELFVSGHGPTWLPQEWFRSGGDELNVVVAGENYGWPDASGAEEGDEYPLPIAAWTPAIAPGALAFFPTGPEPWRTSVFIASLRGESLVRVELVAGTAGWEAVGEERLFAGEYGRIRAVARSPDGDLYFTTSNRDGRGDPRPGDDMILRIRATGSGNDSASATRLP